MLEKKPLGRVKAKTSWSSGKHPWTCPKKPRIHAQDNKSPHISNPKPKIRFIFIRIPHIKDELRIGDVNANLSKV